MKVVFYSNFLNHHQLPLCNEFMKRENIEFTFVANEPIPQSRLSMNYQDMNNYSFVLRSYESDKNFEKALKLSELADIVIIGSAPICFMENRLKKTNKLTFRFCERSLKKGMWRRFIPRTRNKIKNEYIDYINYNLFILGSSAYTSNDLTACGFPLEKCYQWGYFPEIKKYTDIKQVLSLKKTSSILWVARFIELKHPEIPILIAKRLREDGFKFKLYLIGNGKLESKIRQKIIKFKLEDCVFLLGSMTPEDVRAYMEKSQIFLFTSDRNEGWGAVLNEAMNSGCAVVASHAIGSVPFLIEDNKNGIIYRDGDVNDLYDKVKKLLKDTKLCNLYGEEAYNSMIEKWNAEIAVSRLLNLSTHLINDNEYIDYQTGPCSKALIYKNNWYGRRKHGNRFWVENKKI